MLIRVLNLDEQGVRPAPFHGGYFFFPSMLARLKLFNKESEWTSEDVAVIEEGIKKSFDTLQDYLEAAEKEGQKILVKEHISFLNEPRFEYEHMYGTLPGGEIPKPMTARGFPESTRSPLNMTALPDEFLKTWYPTFLIRHPALMLSSLYRTAQKDVELYGSRRAKKEPFEFETTMKFTRSLFDFYTDHFGGESKWPIVLDADDVIQYPELVMKYAGIVGLDPETLKFSWEKASKEMVDGLQSAAKIMLSTINASTGMDKGKVAGNVDIDAEAEKWRVEFGEEGGRKLEKWVRDAMPDYEYLRSRRLRLE